MEAPESLAAFPAEPDEAVLARCPEIIRGIVENIIDAAEASPQCVTAVAMAVMATALGPNARVASPFAESVPVMFNVAVSHVAPRTLPWFDLLASPLTLLMLNMQIALALNGPEKPRRETAQWYQELLKARQTKESPDLESFLGGNLNAARAGLNPGVAASRVSYQEIAQLLPRSFDGGVTTFGLCSDPGEELLRLKANERARIVEILNRSWMGTPIALGSHLYPGTLSLLWQTARPAKDLIGPHGFDPKLLAVPVLMLEERHASIRPLPQLPHQPGWKQTIKLVFERRCGNEPTVFAVSEEGETAFDEFSLRIEQCLDQVPVDCRGHLAWVPELARRLALLFSILSPEKATTVSLSAVQDGIAVTSWLARQHLRSVVSNPVSPDTAACVDRTDRVAVMLDKIRTKSPTTRRELWRSFDNPKADWFHAALESLISSGRVRCNDQKELEACQ